MIFVPFIFFLVILICLLWQRKQMDLASYIAFLYVAISFLGILNDFFKLRFHDVVNYEYSFEATFVYCVLLGLFLIPIIRYTKVAGECLSPVENSFLLKSLSIISFLFFLIVLCGNFTTLIGILNGDLAALRHAIYAGDKEEAWFRFMPYFLQQIVIVGTMFFSNYWILQFLSFFCLFIQKIEWKYSIFFFIASLSGPLWGILAIDRSKVTYWIIALGANFFLFNRYMTKKQRTAFIILSSVCVCFLMIYLSMMTDARFGNRSYGGGVYGAFGGVISYLGQSFVNFAFFYDEFVNDTPTLAAIFPYTYRLLWGEFGSLVPLQEYLTNIYHLQFGVFYTFLGSILISAGKIVMFMYALILSSFAFSYFNPSFQKDKSLLNLYLFMAYSSIMFLGLFTYSYAYRGATFSLICWGLLFRIMSIRNK